MLSLGHLSELGPAAGFPTVPEQDAPESNQLRPPKIESWWKNAASSQGLPDLGSARKRRKLEGLPGLNLCLRRPLYLARAAGKEPDSTRSDHDTAVPALSPTPWGEARKLQEPPCHDMMMPAEIPEPEPLNVLEMVRTQYLEALYISKTSLAYFAKGPLSRARASFKEGKENPDPSRELIVFLQDCVLPLALSDKKYRETLPGMVQELPGFSNSDDDDLDTPTAKLKVAKRRKAMKVKPKRNGLVTNEESYVARWWKLQDADVEAAASMDSKDDMTRRKIAHLRARETELQMIIILETIALQSTTPQATESVFRASSALQARKADEERPQTKKKKPDLGLQLELLLDRLCIWQSLSQEESLKSEGTGPTAAKTGGKAGLVEQELSRPTKAAITQPDSLRNFCVEVIIPFYATRLPEKCATISRKLGGPKVSNPVQSARDIPSKDIRPPLKQRRDKAKPRAPSGRNARKPLERVMTDGKVTRDSSRQGCAPPPLTRSVTAPAVPNLKHEASETPLSTLPAMVANRGGLVHSKRFQQREVDLGATTGRADARARGKANISAELDKAIAVLKKPNRGLAVKENVETSERRALGLKRDAGVTKIGAWSRASRTVQVMATPKGNRRKHIDRMESPSHKYASGYAQENRAPDLPHPPSDPRIPSSSQRPSQMPLLPGDPVLITSPTLTRRNAGPAMAVQATPTRGRIKDGDSVRPGASDGDMSRQGCPATPPVRGPAVPASVTMTGFIPWSLVKGSPEGAGGSLQETPSKRRRSCTVSTDAVNVAKDRLSHPTAVGPDAVNAALSDPVLPVVKARGADAEPSIYQSLGWDDEDDELA